MQFLYRPLNFFFACLKYHEHNQIYFTVSASIAEKQGATILYIFTLKKFT